MSPHYTPETPDTNGECGCSSIPTNGLNGSANGYTHAQPVNKSHLQPSDPDAMHDLICVGFGPASLAIAVALHDALEDGSIQEPPKVVFLEKQPRFAWHAGMLLPGAKMQISFIKDMATLRSPRSNFTFLNYLHASGRLVEFTNLSTFLPSRVEYEDYLRWCARHFDDVVQYGVEATTVSRDEDGIPVHSFRVSSKDLETGTIRTYRARNILMAIGGQPSVPRCLPADHPRVIHSSQYAHLVPKLLNDTRAAYRVAVVGAGQSAAEIFNNIQVLYPNSRTWLVMRSEFLKPSDDSPFVNSIFNPDYIDSLYPKPAKYRSSLLTEARTTNYGVVRLELIEKLYERMYDQRRELGSDERKWPHHVLGGHRVVHAEPRGDGLQLRVRQTFAEDWVSNDILLSDGQPDRGKDEILDVDMVIAATGYRRDVHVDMLQDLWPLLPEGDSADVKGLGSGWEVQSKAVVDGDVRASPRRLEVSRNYRIEFSPGLVAPGSGIWLQGCCEGSHGLSDTLLSVLATRSGEIVNSIFGHS